MDKATADFRSRFPALSRQVYGKPLVYFDNAATSQRPDCVLEMQDVMNTAACANVHRAVHRLANDATELYQKGREAAAAFIGAPADGEVIFTSGTTAGINLVASSFGRQFLRSGDKIIISDSEHHSDIVPWQLACEIHGSTLEVVPTTEDGSFDMDAYLKLLDGRVRIVAVAQMTNVSGVSFPLKEIISAAHDAGAAVLVDGAQGIVHDGVDVGSIDCDFYAFSGHKIYAPTGTGILYGKRSLLEQMPPYMGGGDMVDRVTFEKTTYGPLPLKFEAGTQNISAAACLAPALGLAAEAMTNAELQAAFSATESLMAEQLRDIPGLHCPSLDNPARKGLFSFYIDGVHPADAAQIMDKMGVAVRTGFMCAEPYVRKYSDHGMMRASLMPYNTPEEVGIFIQALRRAVEMLR